ncbi:S-layer homology domain-containing protein [Vallitalea okinawensis]|uniref:S-layer homology domain-containing protein n=1 Tax=Vallitalea okinawensis TaxID=2078660 RepID=UPI000CFDB12C|nr:S-layer homology domain-containing protein [Vallitalea okinawensis]
MSKSVRVLGLLLAFVLFLQPVNVFSATDEQTYAANQLVTLGIVTGYEDGSLRLDNNITRAEVATILVKILGYDDKHVVANEELDFSDVSQDFWAFQNIEKAAALGLISGYPEGTFKPNQNITFAEMTATMLRAIGAEVDPNEPWPTNYMSKGQSIGLITEESIDPNHIVTRGEVFEYLWRTLLIKH